MLLVGRHRSLVGVAVLVVVVCGVALVSVGTAEGGVETVEDSRVGDKNGAGGEAADLNPSVDPSVEPTAESGTIALAGTASSFDQEILMSRAPGLTVAAAPMRAAVRTYRPYFAGGGISGRLLTLDPAYNSFSTGLTNYGYGDVARTAYALDGFVGYRHTPIADVGATIEYGYARLAKPSGKDIAMRTHYRQVGLFLRPRLRGHDSVFDLGVRFDLGLAYLGTTVRNEEAIALVPYARAQLDVMVGGRSMGAHIYAGLGAAFGARADEGVAPPLGGLSVGVGLYRRFDSLR